MKVFTISFFFAAFLAAQAQENVPRARSPLVQVTGAADLDAAAKKTIVDFFSTLQTGDVDAAYDRLTGGTKIAEQIQEIVMLKTKTREAIKVLGDLQGHEIIDEKLVGSRLLRLTCTSLGKEFPLRWRFYFYRPVDAWRLIDIRVDDRLADMFDEKAEPSASVEAK